MVVPGNERQLESYLTEHGINWNIKINDVQHLVNQENVLFSRWSMQLIRIEKEIDKKYLCQLQKINLVE